MYASLTDRRVLSPSVPGPPNEMEPRRSASSQRSLRLRFALLALLLTQCFDSVLCGEKLGKWLYRFPYLQLGSHHWVNAHTPYSLLLLVSRMPKWNQQRQQQQQQEHQQCSLLACPLFRHRAFFLLSFIYLSCYLTFFCAVDLLRE